MFTKIIGTVGFILLLLFISTDIEHSSYGNLLSVIFLISVTYSFVHAIISGE